MDETLIAFGRPVTGLQALSDETFLKSIAWSRSAPVSLTQPARLGDVEAFSRALQKQGFAGAAGKKTKKALLQKQSLWSCMAYDESPRAGELANLWEKLESKGKSSSAKIGAKQNKQKRKNGQKTKDRAQAANNALAQLGRWLETASVESPLSPFELLVLFEMLREIGTDLPDAICWPLWRQAFSTAVELSNNLDEPIGSSATNDQRLLVGGELPWEAGLLFAGVKGAGKLGRSGGKYLRRQLEKMTDTDGTPNADLMERMSLWLSVLVRSADWAKHFKAKLWDDSTAERFDFLLECAAAVCRADGHFALGNGHSRDVTSLLASASRLAGWKKKSPPSKYLSAVGNGSRKSRISGRTKMIDILDEDDYPTAQSDWAQLACLRNDWSITPDTLVVAHHRDKPMIDLTVLGQPLISGVWDIDLQIDGKSVVFDDDWECTCWYSDEDADYLELSTTLASGVEIERLLLLSRNEHFAILADVVTASSGSRIEYTSQLPLVSGVVGKPGRLTRECALKNRPVNARAFPVGLPCERVDSAAGSFSLQDNRLELNQVAENALFAPVVIDWAPERKRSYADWRNLTVTEDGKVLKRSAASAHRIRVGDHQLFIYRSINSSDEHRAVLGLHTDNETVIGIFEDDGEVDPIVMVE